MGQARDLLGDRRGHAVRGVAGPVPDGLGSQRGPGSALPHRAGDEPAAERRGLVVREDVRALARLRVPRQGRSGRAALGRHRRRGPRRMGVRPRRRPRRQRPDGEADEPDVHSCQARRQSVPRSHRLPDDARRSAGAVPLVCCWAGSRPRSRIRTARSVRRPG